MTNQHSTTEEITEDYRAADDQERDRSEQETTILFHWSDDPFVNEAAAELGRQLANEGLVEIHPTHIETTPNSEIETVANRIKQILERALRDTHRRTTVAHQVNGALESLGRGSDDDRWVSPPDTHFPGRNNDDQTAYPDDVVDTSILEDHGISTEDVEYVDDDSSSLYTLSPTFVGNPSTQNFRYQVDRFQRYLGTYLDTLTNDFEFDDAPCMICGSEDMPTTKGANEKKLEFNQSFNILSTASAVSAPLGMAGRTTAHSGRCVACLIAGFYYTLMPKVIRYKDNETCGGSFPIPVYRVFTPQGDFSELVGIRDDYQDILEWIDAPTTNDRARRGTLPGVWTQSRALQTLQFYETILKYINAERTQDHYDFAVEHRPTAVLSYTSASQKSGRRQRDIRELEAIDPDSWAYAAVKQRTLPDGEMYWPFDDLLGWYARLDDVPVGALDDLGYGIAEQDLIQLERGHFEVAKTLERNQGINADYVLPIQRAATYFSIIMQKATQVTTESIDEESIKSIKRVASNVGETFYQRDDISVLIALQNASTSDEFLQAFEKASMQAQKKASSEGGSGGSWSGQNDVAQVLKLISDQDTFEPTKRMFVIHASLAAQYMNSQRTSEGGEEQ